MSMSDLVVVVLGVDVHPGSGRRVVPRSDVAALEMALDLGRPLLALHAGDPSDPALKSYLGLGLLTLAVLEVPGQEHADQAVVEHLRGMQASLILTGVRPGGTDAGMLPYALSAALGMPMLRQVRAVVREESGWLIDTTIGLGRSRNLRCHGPLVATLDAGVPAKRFSTYGAGRQGRIDVVGRAAGTPGHQASVAVQAARPRPVTLEPVRGAHFSTRYQELADRPQTVTQIRKGLGAQEVAAQILYLIQTHQVGIATGQELDKTP
jgi:electron transfer flavoprotein beta subunit